MKSLVSVIVPIYNVKKYINRCLQSIVNPTYKILDIMLVNEGSTDESGIICDFYSQKDCRRAVVNKKNGSLSFVRNLKFNICSGEYNANIKSR